jgi:hypothetical protein
MAGLHRITSGFAEWTAHDCIERPYDTARSHLVCLVLASVAYVMASQGSTGANCDEAMRTSLIHRDSSSTVSHNAPAIRAPKSGDGSVDVSDGMTGVLGKGVADNTDNLVFSFHSCTNVTG